MSVCTLVTREFGFCEAHADDTYMYHIKLSLDSLKAMSKMWQMGVHGDFRHNGKLAFDVEFPNLHMACMFELSNNQDFVIQFRDDPPADFNTPVTLTVWQRTE